MDSGQQNSSHQERSQLGRRAFLKTAAAAAGAAALDLEAPAALEGAPPPAGLIDVNVNLSRWPLRRLRFDDSGELAAMLESYGAAQAWAGTFDGLMHKDIAAANARLAEECRRSGRGLLRPFGSVNPMLPDWEDDLRRCAEEHRMPGLRLHPNYHGYKLDDPAFVRLLQLAAERRLLVQIALVMEDERMMHPLWQVPPVDVAPLARAVKEAPRLQLVLLNAALRTLRGEPLRELLSAGEVYVEISMLEGAGGVKSLLEQAPLQRVLFGSHAPLFYFESALLKLQESALSEEELQAIRGANARRLLAAAGKP